MNKFLSIQNAAKWMRVSPQTLRRWERAGKIKPAYRTEGNQRCYDPSSLHLRYDRKLWMKGENERIFWMIS